MLILRGPEHPVDSLVFSPDAATLYAVHHFSGVHAWDLAERTGAPVALATGEAVHGEFVVHPAGRWAFGRCPAAPSPPPQYNTTRAIDLHAGAAPYFNFYGWPNQSVALLPGVDHFVTVGHSQYEEDPPPAELRGKRIYGWAMAPAGPEPLWHRDIPRNEDSRCAAMLDAERFATADFLPPTRYVSAGFTWRVALTVRSVADGAPLAQIDFPEMQIQQLLASPDARLLVGRLGTMLWAWDANDLARPPVAVAGKDKHWMTGLAAAFHPSGRYLLLANDGLSVIAFDTNTWQPVRKWNWKAGVLRAVGVSPDGALAAASGPRGTVVVWDLDL